MIKSVIPALALATLVSAEHARGADVDAVGSFGPGAPPTFYVHVGAAGMLYSESAKIRVLGVLRPGADVSIGDVATPAAELGYYVTPNVAVSAAAGFPPLSKVDGAGLLLGVGKLGKVTGGPVSASIHYHLLDWGWLRPYIGAGIASQVIVNEHDGALQHLRVNSALGPMVQAGVDLMIDDRWGVFVDVKKAWLESKATAVLGGAPISSRVTLDPLVVHSGVTFNF